MVFNHDRLEMHVQHKHCHQEIQTQQSHAYDEVDAEVRTCWSGKHFSHSEQEDLNDWNTDDCNHFEVLL